MCPMLDSTSKSGPRKPLIVRAFAGDSTMTSRLDIGARVAGGAKMRLVASRPSRMYRFIGFVSAPVVHGLFRLEARGLERLPQGGFVLAANHLSNFDPWPLGMPLLPQRWLRFMAKSELYWWPLSAVRRPRRARSRCAARRRRHGGDRDCRRARARGRDRRHVPRGHAQEEGRAQEATRRGRTPAPRASRTRGRAARPGGDQGNRPPGAARQAAGRLRRRRSSRATTRARRPNG